MCNCGNKRIAWSQNTHQQHVSNNMHAKMVIPPQTNAWAAFEYTGKTALTVNGNVTRRQYRFYSPGNRQNIDYRDVPGLLPIPVLKRVG
jgi:hypothetical protein